MGFGHRSRYLCLSLEHGNLWAGLCGSLITGGAILSDNPGHLSAYEYFQFGHVYPLGDEASLLAEIRQSLSNFTQESRQAQAFAPRAKELYQPEKVYQEILQGIDQQSPSQKPLRHLGNLVTYNEERGRLARFEKRFYRFVNRGKAWLARKRQQNTK